MNQKVWNPLTIAGSSGAVWAIVRRRVKREVGGKCELCLTNLSKNWHLHHRNGCGLDNQRLNLQALCPNCHMKQKESSALSQEEKAAYDLSFVLQEEELSNFNKEK